MIQWINKKRNKKGFTLIELVVVIAILGVLVAIAVPRLSGFADRGEEAAADATVRTLNSATAVFEAEGGDVSGDDEAAIYGRMVASGFIQTGTDVTVYTYTEGDGWTR